MKHKFLICFLLSALICLGSVALADEIAFIKKDGFITKITEKSGEVYELPGIIDADKIEKSQCADEIFRYEILKGDKVLITVNFVDIKSEANALLFGESAMQNGYYSTEFTLSEEDNTEVFLTGLTPENLEKVQSALLDAVIKNSEFYIEDIDFIDAEKVANWGDGDDLLCWAATSSNMLHYTGWGKKANPAFNTSDDIFENFKANFTDQGGNAYYGFEWFFDGFYTQQGVEGWAQVKNYGSSGGYLKQYSPAQFIKSYHSKDIVNHFYNGYKLLHDGYGVYLTIDWMNEDEGKVYDAHAITLWGYICDKDYSERNHEFFKAFIVSDSDDYQLVSTDRRNSPNILHVLNLSYYNKFGYNTWKADGYNDCGILEGYTALPPYSDSILFETDEKATKNSLTSPDLLPQDISFIQSGNTFSLNDYNKFYSGSSITLKTQIGNDSATQCPYGANLKLEVINKKTGKQVYSKSYDITAIIPVYSPFYLDWQHKLPTLEKGQYSAVLTLNEGKKITESYYYNNTKTWDFEIVEKATAPSKITASVEKFVKGKAKVGFTISGVDKSKLSENAEGYIYKSVYKDGAWGEYIITSTNGGTVPTSCYIEAEGTKIKFKYVLFNDKNAQPLEVISPEYKLSYDKLSLALGEEHIYYSPFVEYGAKSFGEYSKYVFDVKNESTVNNGKIQYNVSVITKTDNKVLMKKEGEQLAFGESIEYEFSSWDEDISAGEHEVYAILESDNCGILEIYLGSFYYNEKGSLIVNCEGESEPYDGKTSLREAIRYAVSTPGAGDVVIPKGYKITLDSTLDIYGDYTLDGNGCEITCLSGGFFPLSYNSVTLKNLTLNGEGRTVWGIDTVGATVHLENVNFINMKNSKMGVALNIASGSKVYAKNCTFSGNIATGNYITYSNGSTVQFVNCVWENNSTYNDQVYFQGSNVVVAHCIFGKLNGLNAFAENTHFKACNNGAVSVYGSIIAGNVSGYVSLYGSFIGGKGSNYVSCTGTTVGEIDTIMLTDEEGNPVYKNGEYILSDKIYDGVMLKNDGGKLYYSYDGVEWKNSYKDTVFETEDFSRDIEGKQGTKFIGAYAKAAEKGAVISADDENMILFVPREGSGYFGVSSYKDNGSLDTFEREPVSLLSGKNTIPIPERENGRTYTYMMWNENMEPMTEAYVK